MAEPVFPAELRVPSRVLFGPGVLRHLGEVAGAFGKRALLVTGSASVRRGGTLGKIEAVLQSHGVASVHVTVRHEPDVESVDKASAMGRSAGCDFVIAVGGGSVIDLAKSAAGMIPNEGSLLDYLEGVGTGKTMARAPLPLIAVPTTAGTGSEATKNAVINGYSLTRGPFKKSFRDPRLVPAVALVDPELSMGASSEITTACGMDALTQLVESLTSLHATAVTDALAVSGIEAVGRSLQRAVENGYGLEARVEMAYAALLSGICLSNAGLGAVHGLASPVSAHAPVPPGHICAVRRPLVTGANLAALREGRGRQEALRGYERAEEALGAPIAGFCGRFRIRGFGSFGLKLEDLSRVVAGATSGSMKTNPVELTPQELEGILKEAL